MRSLICLLALLIPATLHAEIHDDWETVSGAINQLEPEEREASHAAFYQTSDADANALEAIDACKAEAAEYKAQLLRAWTTDYMSKAAYDVAIDAVDAVIASMTSESSAYQNGLNSLISGMANHNYNDARYWLLGWWELAEADFDAATASFNTTRDFACTYEASLWSNKTALKAAVDAYIEAIAEAQEDGGEDDE